jgi:hypothetical protein
MSRGERRIVRRAACRSRPTSPCFGDVRRFPNQKPPRSVPHSSSKASCRPRLSCGARGYAPITTVWPEGLFVMTKPDRIGAPPANEW